MIVMSPGDNKVKESQSDTKVGHFGGNRKVTDNVQSDEDYTKPSLARCSNVESEGIPAEDTTKDIDDMNDPEARKREASRRAETNSVGAENEYRRAGDGDKIFSEPDNRPTGEGREDDGVVVPDDKKHGSNNPYHFGEYITIIADIEPSFFFQVKTTSLNETFTLPLEITGTYDFNVDWGDGNKSDITVWDHADVTHTYASAGTHEIRITGTITGWRFNNSGDCAKYYETKSWGPLRLGNSNGYFYGCVNHTCTATDVLDLAGITTMFRCFQGNTSLVTLPSVNSWDFSNVLTLNQFLEGCSSFNQDLSGIDTSGIRYMTRVFANASVFDQDLSSWDISSLTSATQFLLNATLSVANFNALILSWSAQAASGAYTFHGGSSKYTTGGAVLAAWNAWAAKGWTLQSGGENLGSELTTDGNMETDPVNNWTGTATRSAEADERTGGAGAQCIEGTLNFDSTQDIFQNQTTEAGKLYKAEWWHKNINASNLDVQIWDSIDGTTLTTKIDEVINIETDVIWTTGSIYFTALGVNTIFRFRIGSLTAQAARLDDISLKAAL